MSDSNQISKRKIRRNLITIILLTVTLLLVVFFGKNLLAASPMFFGYRGKDVFGVYSANLEGKNFKTILLDERREMTHARISPDQRHLTFTRYNRVLKDGLCEENGSDYLHTEVIVASADGSSQHSVESVGPEIMSANSSWIDNDSIIYIHKPNLKVLPRLRIYQLSTGKTRSVAIPANLAPSDPTCRGNVLVFPIIPLVDKEAPCALWTCNLDGSGLRQVTKPVIVPTSQERFFKLGDYDPWLSPDGKSVVFMRYFGGMDWRILTASISDGKEKLLTEPGIPSGIPKFNNNGTLIAFVCWDKSKLENLGLYTFAVDSSNRKKVPLPPGYLYTHPSFIPRSNLNSEELIFSGRKVPGLPQ